MSPTPGPSVTWADREAQSVAGRVRREQPLVHCLTNIVVAGFTANVLLAAGASPAMVENAAEAGIFAAVAGGVLVNLGTLTPGREDAMRGAAAGAQAAGVPWVLDPVAVGALEHRTVFARELLDYRPAIVRGNASEIQALAGEAGTGGRGVDSLAGSDEAVDAARSLASACGCVVAVSGATDYVVDPDQVVEVPGGDPLMTRVTGVGCALGALMAAGAGVSPGAFLAAAVGASALLAEAGARSAAVSRAPGSFAVALIDQIDALSADAAGT
ncbi:MAG: hydroxyethylthiazole kinase [Acidimicrobiales bacterium]